MSTLLGFASCLGVVFNYLINIAPPIKQALIGRVSASVFAFNSVWIALIGGYVLIGRRLHEDFNEGHQAGIAWWTHNNWQRCLFIALTVVNAVAHIVLLSDLRCFLERFNLPPPLSAALPYVAYPLAFACKVLSLLPCIDKFQQLTHLSVVILLILLWSFTDSLTYHYSLRPYKLQLGNKPFSVGRWLFAPPVVAVVVCQFFSCSIFGSVLLWERLTYDNYEPYTVVLLVFSVGLLWWIVILCRNKDWEAHVELLSHGGQAGYENLEGVVEEENRHGSV